MEIETKQRWNDGSLRVDRFAGMVFRLLYSISTGEARWLAARTPVHCQLGMVRLQNFTGRARFTGLSDAAL
ncbi:MAG: hypothetical protein IPM61_16410 [Chlorobi bacterium]|nr:hypothetical protein [Chlorobiota bacterium]